MTAGNLAARAPAGPLQVAGGGSLLMVWMDALVPSGALLGSAHGPKQQSAP